ncbi:MAG: serine hydrolase domain-containing protein [Halioglobus sp.]
MTRETYTIHPAEQVGLFSKSIEALVERAQRGVDEGPLPSVQIALARKGKLALFTSLGDADNSCRYNIFSCTKGIVAAAVWKLMGLGKVNIHRPVSEIIPEFSGDGKERITTEQLLCHTAGIPHAPMGPPEWLNREDRLLKMQSWRLNWEPGSRMEYHSNSAHWVLAEIIERASGLDYRQYIHQSILAPLGLTDFQLGVPLEQQQDIATLSPVGAPPTPQELEQIFGVAVEWPVLSDDILLRFNEPQTRALGVPGGGAIANAASIALFYQALLHNTEKLWDHNILEDATSAIRVSMDDPNIGLPANRGLGIVIAGNDGMGARRGMGRTSSEKTFGHQGAGGQVAWADPVSGISFCLLTNGLDANPIRAARFGTALSNRAAQCHVAVDDSDRH